MRKRKRSITHKITFLLLAMTATSLLLVGAVSVWSLYSMKTISMENSVGLRRLPLQIQKKRWRRWQESSYSILLRKKQFT